MGTRCHIAVTGAEAGIVRARYVHSDGNPGYILATLRAIWADTFARDTAAFAEAVLATDWSWLGADATAATEAGFAGEHPVPGVGLAMTFDGDTGPAVLDLASIGRLGTDWVYIVDPATNTVAVHTGAGDHVTDHHLDP